MEMQLFMSAADLSPIAFAATHSRSSVPDTPIVVIGGSQEP
jgi:hypothetical protein